MKCMTSDPRCVLLPIVLLLCGCPQDSSRSQSTGRGNAQQSGAVSSDAATKKPAKDASADPLGKQSQTESPEDRLARQVDELATKLASSKIPASGSIQQQLVRLGPDAALPLWERLQQAPTDDSLDSYSYRVGLLWVLAQLRNPALIQPTFEKLTHADLHQRLRKWYENILKELGDQSRPMIDRLAQHERAEVRESGVRLLADFRDPEATKVLKAALQDESSRVRFFAASGLAANKDDTALDVLKDTFRDTDMADRLAAVAAVKRYDAKKAVPVLAAFLDDPDSLVRYAVILALGEIKDSRAMELIDAAARKGDRTDRNAAFEAYKRMDSPEAARAVGEWLKHEDPNVCRIAQTCLKSMKTPEAKSILDQSPQIDYQKMALDEIDLRTQCSNQLKRIAVAMHNYHEAHGKFPPAIGYGPDGKTPHSWRVALLPFLGQAELHKKCNFKEPWDSPNNTKLLEEIPAAYRCPKVDGDSTCSSYFVLTGPSTVFSGPEGTSRSDIIDGTNSTLLVVEAKRDIPWTRPADIPYDLGEPLPKLGGMHSGGSYASFADGSVRWIADSTPEKDLRALCTKAGKEP